MAFTAFTTAWYWTEDGLLRECIVLDSPAGQVVLDLETLDEAQPAPPGVLMEHPSE